MAKMPDFLLWFLGIGAKSGAIANQIFKSNVDHIFSRDHKIQGIMKLG